MQRSKISTRVIIRRGEFIFLTLLKPLIVPRHSRFPLDPPPLPQPLLLDGLAAFRRAQIREKSRDRSFVSRSIMKSRSLLANEENI